MVSNYPSDTAYAWWLMEHFWRIQATIFDNADRKSYLAYPKITSLSQGISNSPIIPVELPLPWRSKKQAQLTSSFIRDHNISYIYLTDQPYFSARYTAMRLWGVKNIIVHDHTPGDRPPVGGIKGAVKALKNMLPGFTADHLLCVSDLMRQRNILNSRIPPRKCSVIQNGIQPVNCSNIDNAKLRTSLGLSPSSILVITSGRAHPYKRFDFIIKCASVVRDQYPELDVAFLLAGDGPAMPELKRLVTQLNLDRNVRLLGYRNDIRGLLCISDIALHAALGEGFSLSIIEYMSAGLPVLAPDIPSVSQAITHNINGFIYQQNDPNAVASFINALAANRQMRLNMGKEAKQRANESYSLDQCTLNFTKTVTKIYSLPSSDQYTLSH